jgi:hypothetical protein
MSHYLCILSRVEITGKLNPQSKLET